MDNPGFLFGWILVWMKRFCCIWVTLAINQRLSTFSTSSNSDFEASMSAFNFMDAIVKETQILCISSVEYHGVSNLAGIFAPSS